MSEWYYNRGGQQQGPVSEQDLKNLAAQGQLSDADMVWKEGMGDWQPAGQVPGLLPPSPAGSPYASPLAAGRRDGGGASYLLLLISGGLMFVAFVMPWWYATIDGTDEARDRAKEDDGGSSESRREKSRDANHAMDWYSTHFSRKRMEEIQEDLRENSDEDEKKVTQRLWGWRVWPAWYGLAAALLIIPCSIMGMTSAPARRWVWVMILNIAFLAALVGLGVAWWIIGSPGTDIKSSYPNLFLGCHIGAYLMLLGSAAAAVFGFSISVPACKKATGGA